MNTNEIDANSPCTATVTPTSNGGMQVALNVPTYSGVLPLELTAERQADGDWIVFLVNTDGLDAMNGIVYLGAPDVPRAAARAKRDKV
jgi:hypothetical protein